MSQTSSSQKHYEKQRRPRAPSSQCSGTPYSTAPTRVSIQHYQADGRSGSIPYDLPPIIEKRFPTGNLDQSRLPDTAEFSRWRSDPCQDIIEPYEYGEEWEDREDDANSVTVASRQRMPSVPGGLRKKLKTAVSRPEDSMSSVGSSTSRSQRARDNRSYQGNNRTGRPRDARPPSLKRSDSATSDKTYLFYDTNCVDCRRRDCRVHCTENKDSEPDSRSYHGNEYRNNASDSQVSQQYSTTSRRSRNDESNNALVLRNKSLSQVGSSLSQMSVQDRSYQGNEYSGSTSTSKVSRQHLEKPHSSQDAGSDNESVFPAESAPNVSSIRAQLSSGQQSHNGSGCSNSTPATTVTHSSLSSHSKRSHKNPRSKLDNKSLFPAESASNVRSNHTRLSSKERPHSGNESVNYPLRSNVRKVPLHSGPDRLRGSQASPGPRNVELRPPPRSDYGSKLRGSTIYDTGGKAPSEASYGPRTPQPLTLENVAILQSSSMHSQESHQSHGPLAWNDGRPINSDKQGPKRQPKRDGGGLQLIKTVTRYQYG